MQVTREATLQKLQDLNKQQADTLLQLKRSFLLQDLLPAAVFPIKSSVISIYPPTAEAAEIVFQDANGIKYSKPLIAIDKSLWPKELL